MEQNSKILIVDDEEQVLHMLSLMLMELGWQVAAAAGPEEALPMALADRYDLAIVDNHLGSMEGIELIERLREVDGELPCVLMTGSLNIDTTANALKKGVAGFLRKPFRVEELLVCIEQGRIARELLQRQRKLLSEGMQNEREKRSGPARTQGTP